MKTLQPHLACCVSLQRSNGYGCSRYWLWWDTASNDVARTSGSPSSVLENLASDCTAPDTEPSQRLKLRNHSIVHDCTDKTIRYIYILDVVSPAQALRHSLGSLSSYFCFLSCCFWFHSSFAAAMIKPL